MKNIIEQIARENGVTPAEVERDIKEALEIAMQNPQKQEFWRVLCPSGVITDIETVIEELARLV